MLDTLDITALLVVVFAATQVLYALGFLNELYLYSLPIDRVRMADAEQVPARDYPHIVMFYPVLNELESTMRTTLVALGRIRYPAAKRQVIAVPNWDDAPTIAALRRLQAEFPFLEVLETPPTDDPSWQLVWETWDANPRCYWWHEGRHAGERKLPPKKTRQLIYAFYQVHRARRGEEFLVNYIDADSCPPPGHFMAAVAGMRRYDVLQAKNVAGNLNASLAASWHALDHMNWDGMKYAHLSGGGRQPFWMLGKGLFFRASDLYELGSFHPWITIEDPEVGMRFWKNGKRLGIIESPLIEEVPLTFGRGITQRKRWICGFLQSLGEPLTRMGFTPLEKLKAWLNFLPCLSLWINVVGYPVGAWAAWTLLDGQNVLPAWLVGLAVANTLGFLVSLACLYANTWRRTGLVLDSVRARAAYMLRVNPLFVIAWWWLWLVPQAIGIWMYLRDLGQVWERTEKVNANEDLIQVHYGGAAHQAVS